MNVEQIAQVQKLNKQSLDAAKIVDRDDPGAGSISVFTKVFCIRYYTWIGKGISVL